MRSSIGGICRRWRALPLVSLVWLAVFSLGMAAAAERQKLSSRHVPAAVARLAPLGDLPDTQRLELAIGLPLRNQGELDTLLHDLYDPASPSYHRYLTPEQFTERFGPTEQDYQALMDFAHANGLTVTATHPNRVVLEVAGTVTNIAKTFQVTLRAFQHPTEARTFYAPDVEPTVDFAVPILHISGLDDYAPPHPNCVKRSVSTSANVTPNAGTGPGGAYQGSDFRAAYVPGTSLTGAGQSVGLLQFDGFYGIDITNYESQAGLPNVPLTVVAVNGGISKPGSGAVEVSLDIEMSISMAPGLSRVYIYEAPNKASNWDPLLSRMANDNLAKQLSCSWGGGSADATAEGIFKQMASQGQSFFNATGDSDAFTGSIPFPSDSTNITEVGGTTLTTGSGASYSSETAWNWNYDSNCSCYVGSSGGISTYYPIPAYQQGISISANQGSTTMRNVPDVALTADNVWVIYGNGSSQNEGGTSCAAPLWAGFTALVNQQAVANGQATVGFLNPAVYALGKSASYASCFHDTTTGNNFWPSSPSKFSAVTGYDLCTGWGTPNGVNLINALTAPPPAVPLLVSNSFTLVAEGCPNGVVDPAETVTVNFGLKNTGTGNTTNLVATLLATGGVLSPSGPQTYGVVSTNGTAVVRPFTFTATGNCGDTEIASLQLQDGTSSLGTVTFSFRLGQASSSTVLSQNFDGVTAPALPAGWATSTSGAESAWVTSTSANDTAPNSAFSPDPASVGVNELDSPSFTLPTGSAQLTFRHNYNRESTYDGGVLEIKIGAGAWTDILAAGGSFVSGAYITTLSSAYSNPLAGRSAWTGNSGGFITTVVNLPASASGQAIQLRWRCGSDNGVSAPGWYVDTVSVISSSYACCTASADLGVSLTASPNPVLAGQNLSYTLTVTNLSSAPASSVTITDALPASVTFVSASPGCVNLGGNVVCNLGTVSGGGTSNFTVVVTPTAGGLITNTLTVSSPTADPNSANNTATTVTTVYALPAITLQPSGQAAIPGTNVTFQVAATGTAPLTYQWRFNGINLAGANSTSLTLTNVQTAQAGTYTVLVTNAYGSVLSSNAVLTMLDPWIVGQPQNRFVTAGGPAVFNVTAVGTVPFSYQWFKDGVPLVDGTNILGSQTNMLVVAQVQLSDLGNYWVVVSNVHGQIVSSNATLNGSFPPVMQVQPLSQTVVAGATASFTAAATGATPISFQWQRAGTNLVDGGKISGSATASLTVSNVQAGETGSYSVVVTNAYGGLTSSNALLSVSPLLGWGRDDYLQADIPGGLANVTGIAAGLYHGLALKADGTVVAWGAGTVNSGVLPNYGQALVPNGLAGVAALAAGAYHSLALKMDGTVTAWGAGTTNSGTTPQYGQSVIPAGLTNVGMIAAGGYHSLALKADGTVVAWGANTYGQTNAPGGLTGVVAIAAGRYHCLALKADGTVTAWGAGTTNTGTQPYYGQSIVPGDLTNVVAIAAGAYHSLALKGDGSLVVWGYNGTGQTNAPGGLSNVVAVAGGFSHSLALKSDGTVAAWGDNSFSQTNDPAVLANAVKIAGGGYHNLALENDGRPSLTVQPVGQAIAAGMTIRLQAMATGVQPLNYQWQLNGTNLAGATSRALILSNVQYSNAGNYTLIVSNSVGTVTSAPALVSVQSPPVLIVQPYAQTVTAGTPVSFSVAAVGNPPFSYQWGLGGSNIAGATLTSYALASAQPANAGDYSVVVTNAFGSAASTNATLTVLVPPAITMAPSNQTAVVGTSASFSVTATGTAPLGYQWTFNGAPQAGATSDTLPLASVQPAQAGSYAVVVTNVAGTVTSAVASLTVLVPPAITAGPSNQTVVVGTNANFAVTATGTTPLVYQWTFGGTNLAGATADTLLLTNVQPDQAGSYAVLVTNVAGFATSTVASLTVLVPPAITTQPSNQTVAIGAKAVFTVTATGSTPLVYQWAFGGTNLAGATAGTLAVTNVQPGQAGSYVVVITNAAGSVTSSAASLTVLPSGTIISLSVLSGTGISITFPSEAGSNYLLEYKNTLDDPAWTPLPPATTATGSVMVLQDTNTPADSRYYRLRRE